MVESEFAAMSACLGASATGVRTYTATASQGLALMYEVLFIVSGMRLPVCMTLANRAMSAPISIWNDHQDSISVRDCGWIQLYAETAQECYDLTLMQFKISENKKVLLENKGYTPYDDFYEALGSYSLFNTCNTWVNSACKESNIKACLWTPYDFGLISMHKNNLY